MTVVDESLVAETPAASAIGGVFGDGLVWCRDDDPRGFDPVTDVAFGDAGEIGVEWMEAAVEHCAQGLSMLERLPRRGVTDRPRQPGQPHRHHRSLTVRRVVIDSKSVVIDMGRTQRLFTGHARDAVMLLEPTCIWPGCDQPHSRCHADHLTSWSTRGPTNPDNGAPLCARHNYLKELGFTITRDANGHWHITAPDGTTIC